MDEEQFVRLIDEHQAVIHKICRVYRSTQHDREDLFQEIVLQLWKSVTGFEGKSKFSTWMYRVALTTALTAFRKKQPAIVYTHELPEHPAGSGHSPAQETLMHAISKLSDADKAIITLYLENLPYREIADVMGISENNVAVKINRIKSRLQQLIKKENV